MSPVKLPKLAGLAEVAEIGGVSRQRAGQLSRHPAFPGPVQTLAATPVWIEAEVRRFFATPRPAGRPSKARLT